MSLRTTLGLSSLSEGTPSEVAEKKRRAYEAAVRPKRLALARRHPRWREIEDDLVPRGRGWLVSAGSDVIYTRFLGAVFAPHSINVIADETELYFVVDADNQLHFFERVGGSWTEHLEKRAARELAKAAPKPRRVPAE